MKRKPYTKKTVFSTSISEISENVCFYFFGIVREMSTTANQKKIKSSRNEYVM